jgi:FkbM family methyltransferase
MQNNSVSGVASIPANPTQSFLTKRWTNLLRTGKSISSMSRLNYSTRERASLLSALRSQGHETDLLNFHVSYLGEWPFRLQLEEIFFRGEYLFEAKSDSPVILDCGANIGLATLFFKHLYPKARISSFEADPATASILQKNIEQNHLDDVSAYNLLLSNAEGEHSFYCAADEAGSTKMSALPDRLSNNREIMVKAGKLSHYIDRPVDLLKLDVEGAELDVMTDLKSSGKLSLIRQVVIEYHHRIGNRASCLARFLALLEEEGFEYQVSGSCDPITRQNVFQDILIGAYRSSAN